MPDVKHAYVSGIADGGDTTLVQPSNWNAAHTWPSAQDVGSLTLSTNGQFELQLVRMTLSSTNRLTLAGALTRVVLFGSTDSTSPNIVGYPFRPTAPIRIPDGYAHRWMGRLQLLTPPVRLIVEGDGEAKLFDDIGPSRAVLTGRG